MKRLGLLIITIFLLFQYSAYAQDTIRKHNIDVSLDVYSQHLWRGFANGTSVSLQPSVEYNYKNFSAGIWGAWCLDGSYTELDLYLAYSKANFTLTLYDYFCPVNPVKNFEFFEISKGKTRHTFDLNLEYSDPERHPFSLLVATMLYGDDLNPENGSNYYSTYIEPAAGFNIGKVRLKVFSGLTPVKSYYASRAAFVNTGVSVSRVFRITNKISLPLNASLVHNPHKGNTWFSLGINL